MRPAWARRAVVRQRAKHRILQTQETDRERAGMVVESRWAPVSKVGTSRKMLQIKKEARLAHYSERKALRSAVDDLPSNHRHRDRHLLDALLGTTEDVFGQDDKISKLSRLDPTFDFLFERQVGVVDRLDPQCFLAGGFLCIAE